MAYRPVTPPPRDPTSRWPWITLGLGLLFIILAAAFVLLRRPSGLNVTVNEPTPTLEGVAAANTAVLGPPPTFTAQPTATSAPTSTATPLPTPTRVPVATLDLTAVAATASSNAPSAASGDAGAISQPPANPPSGGDSGAPQPAQPAANTQPPAVGVTPVAAAIAPLPASQPTVAPTTAPTARPTSAAPTATPAPTPFSGQVANAGGTGNTQEDIQAAYGAPTGESPTHLVVYQKNGVQYSVEYAGDPKRAAVIAEAPGLSSDFSLDQAEQQARRFFPRDATQRGSAPEGNDQFVVERFTSQTLASALPPSVFGNAAAGSFDAVYVKDSKGQIARIIVGAGDDPGSLASLTAS